MPILLTRPSGGAYVLGTRRWQHFSTVRGLTSSADVAPLALWRTRPHTPDEGRSSRVSMRAARATRTPRRASRRPVVRAPRARAALLTGNTSLVADEARRARRLGARRERRRSRAGRKRRRECRRGRGPGSVRSMHSPRNPRAMPSADKDDRARWSGVCRRDCALSVAESTSHAAAKPCRERATAWSALRQPK